jgi:hypothetical protein
MRYLNLGPTWRTHRAKRSRGERARSFAVPLVIATALLVCALPQVASAATWSVTSIQYEKFGELWGNSALEGAACGKTCFVVGHFDGSFSTEQYSLVETGFEGFTREFSGPLGDEGTNLQSVACAEVTSNICTAVGYRGSTARTPFVVHKDISTEWKGQSAPAPSGAISSELTGVSCFRPALCTAVGKWENSSHVQATFAVQWKSEKWTLQTTATPSGAEEVYPGGVSCPTETMCEMAGYYESSGKFFPFAERWNGTAWSLQTVPTPTGSIGSLVHAVSCTRNPTNQCTMVGAYGNEEGSEKTLAERWNGTAWTVQVAASTKGEGATNDLYGVSCVSATECIAVGEIAGPEPPLGEAEIWNGTEWKFQKTASTAVHLRSISCTSSSRCISAGHDNEKKYRVYVENYK